MERTLADVARGANAAPEGVAAAIRQAVNEHPELSKIVQFNSALGGAVGLDALGPEQQDGL